MSVHGEHFGDGGVASLLDDRYELRMEIGRGATGVVWEAFDRVPSEIVAVKVLHQHSSPPSARISASFGKRAAPACSNHPHSVVVRAHGCGPTATPTW